MSTLGAVVDEVKANLGLQGALKDAAIRGYVRTILRGAQQKRWWFLRTSATLTVSTGGDSASLPVDFSVIDFADLIYRNRRYTHETGFRLVDIQDLNSRYLDVEPKQRSKPNACAIFGDNFVLDKQVDTDCRIQLYYFKQDVNLPTADEDTSVMFNEGFDYVRAGAQFMFDRYHGQNPNADPSEFDAIKRNLDDRNIFYKGTGQV